jgi:nucleoside-diphosphate-sugar epimerase
MGWEARVPLRDGLARTMAWIEGNVHRYRVDEYVV